VVSQARPESGSGNGYTVSVLLVSWNTLTETWACLEALSTTVNGEFRLEVIAVDNGSVDGSAELLSSRSGLRAILNESNRGYAAAVNQAYAHATGEFVLLLNSDARFSPGALSTMVGFLLDRPEVAGVAPLYRNLDGSVQQHYMRLPTLASALGIATCLGRLPGFRSAHRRYVMQGADFSRPRRVEQPSTCALLLRRCALDPHTILDENLSLYFTDVLLAHSLLKAGRQLWMTPHAVVTHTMGASTRLLHPAVRTRHHLAGLAHYLARTRRWPTVLLFQVLVGLDQLLRFLLLRRDRLRVRDLVATLRGRSGPLPGAGGPTWVVMLSGVGWASGRHRQHELAREVARDRRVLYVDPPGRRMRWRFSVRQIGPSLWHATPPTVLPFGTVLPPVNVVNRWVAARSLRGFLRDRQGPRLFWIGEALAAWMIGRLGELGVVYDVTDLDWTFTRAWNRRHLRRAEQRAMRNADLVMLSSPVLTTWLSRSAGQHTRIVVVPNACDPALFRPDRPSPDWLRQLPSPRLVYTGAVDTRAFDGPLIARVAADHPEWTFVLAGPSTAGGRALLAALSNVRLIDPLPHEEVPGLLHGCDVCLIPYRLYGLVDYVQPKKLYEYLAMGKPVVATALPALRGLGDLLHLAHEPSGFAVGIAKALARTASPSELSARRSAALANSWVIRGNQVRHLLTDLEGRLAEDSAPTVNRPGRPAAGSGSR
jgi:GT2 family glycosyltransferase/glycosyltransferase involved in cell wall biosynthesis